MFFVLLCLKKVVSGVLGMKIGIDFGSSNFTVFVEDKGIVMSEPSLVVCDSFSGKPLAMGNAAKKTHDHRLGLQVPEPS